MFNEFYFILFKIKACTDITKLAKKKKNFGSTQIFHIDSNLSF